jgi:hypothetical protein
VTKADKAAGQEHRLVLQPRTAITDEFQFSISGPIDPAASSRVAVPEIVLRDVGSVKRRVVLPKQVQNRPITWEMQGLRPIKARDAGADDSVTTCDVVGKPWHAMLRDSEATVEATRVRQAAIRVAWQKDGSCQGVATFEVETGRLTECPLLMPLGARLLHVTVAGVPVDAVPASSGKWLVPFSADLKSQVVEVLYAAGPATTARPIEGSSETNHEAQPSPSQDAAEDADPVVGMPVIEVPASPVSSPWIETRRFHAPKLGDFPVDKTLWMIAGPESFGVGTAEGVDVESTDVRAGQAAAASTAYSWQTSLDEAQALTRCTVAGGADSMTLRYELPVNDLWSGHLTAIAIIIAIAGGLSLLLWKGTLAQCFVRWPFPFGIALGLAWWLWLWPSVIGLLIVAAVLLRQFIPSARNPGAATVP